MCLGNAPGSMEKQHKRVGPGSGVGVPQLAPIAQCSTFLPVYKKERKKRSSLPSVVAHTCNPSRSLGGQEHRCNCKFEVRWSLPGLHGDEQASQGYTSRPCLKQNKKIRTGSPHLPKGLAEWLALGRAGTRAHQELRRSHWGGSQCLYPVYVCVEG